MSSLNLKKVKAGLYDTNHKDQTMTKQEAQEIIQDIIDAAYLNARDIDSEEAKRIDLAAELVFKTQE